jgi:hypothetical protein
MKKGEVIKAFPFALDGINVSHFAIGAAFPPEGEKVADSAFDGLVSAGYITALAAEEIPAEEALNRRIIDVIDRRLAAASDQELKDIIARSGAPYSGNLVHARLVYAAKQQLQAEMEGKAPIFGTNPNAGVTEQPLSKPGEATPPSAAAAVDAQHAQEQTAQRLAGENKATDQFGNPLGSGKSEVSDADLEGMKKDELENLARERDVDISGAKTKAEIIDALKSA